MTDFDGDRITSESFEAFTFPWKIANNSIRHQKMVLRENGTAIAKDA